ncbi:MAG: phosphorylase, partial [Methyloprofundus sp.]|nr:phosphorylase [Methyloprofundus sp.]
MITGILVALPEELHTLTPATLAQGECLSVAENTLVILSGAGIENAEHAAQVLINKGAKQLISWGCAGALSPNLKAGDLVIPTAIIAHNNIQLTPHSLWAKQIISTLEPLIKCYNGKLFESSSIISLAKDKTEQYQETQALAVDMESGAVARLALKANLPFVAIRSIIDPANLDLPQAI